MNQAIGDVLVLAIAVVLSPPPVITIVLLLAGPHPRSNGPAFLLGWLIGLTGVGVVVLVIADEAGAGDDGPASWVSWLMIAIGLALLGLGITKWRGRPRGDEAAELPAWMAAIDAFSARRALTTGILLSGANPKNVLLTMAAAAAIAETGIDAAQATLAFVVFIALGSLGVAAPLTLFFVLGQRSRAMLDGLRSWTVANNTAVMSVLCVIIGATLLGDGIGAL